MKRSQCRLRHIAISVRDVARAQAFFENAFGMTKAGDASTGVYMTDGIMNVALLAKGGKIPGIEFEPFYGVMHFGMWVDDLALAEDQVTRAGAAHFQGRAPANRDVHYEVKYRDPDGIVFDLTSSGWVGAVKKPLP